MVANDSSFFADVSIIIINSIFVAETVLLTIPDRQGVLGGCEINVVGVPKYHGRQNVRVDTELARRLPLVGRIKKELCTRYYGMNPYFVFHLNSRRHGFARGTQVIVVS